MTQTVDLHIWSLAASEADHEYADYLTAEETARKDRFVFERDQTAFLIGRGRLRVIIGQLMGLVPADVPFTYGASGKPAIPGGPQFNLSHSGGIACLAVHPTLTLGADIEAHRPIERDVAKRFFSPTEYQALMALPEADRVSGFYRIWTRKEAVVKALGGGLSIPLDAFDVTLDKDSAALLRLDPVYGNQTDWSLRPFQIGGTMPGAVAVQTADDVALKVATCDSDIPVSV